MGNHIQHTIIGFVVLAIIYLVLRYYGKLPILEPFQILLILFIVWLYSVLPDADQPGSIISKYITVVGGGIIIWAFLTDQAKIGIGITSLLILFRLLDHRTLVHSVFFGILLSAPLWYFDPIYAIVALMAFTGHILSEGEFSLFSDGDMRGINFFGRPGRR